MVNDILNIDIQSNSKKLQADIDDANDKAKKLRATISEIEKSGGKGSENWQKYKNELKLTQEEAKKLANQLKTMDVASLSMRQMEILLKNLNKEWKNMNPSSKEAMDQMKKIGEVEAQMKKVADQAKQIRTEALNLGQPALWTKIKDYMAVAFSVASIQMVISAIINFGKQAIMTAAEVSDRFGDIRKSTGMTTEEVVGLNAEIRKIDTRTAQKDLLEIAKVGGQINIAKNEMLGFVESVDKAVVALGDEFTGGADEVATKMGVLSKLFKETRDLNAGKAINDIGSAINELGAAGSATGPVIADFSARIGSLKMAPKISETLGLGAALQELGLTAEIAAGGLSNVLLGASKATAEYAKQIGVTEAEFKKLINSDPNEVIMRLAASFKGLPTDVVVKQMDALGIKSQEASKVMMLLSDKTEMVKEKQELAAKAMREGTSLTNEFNIKNNTAAAQLAKTGKVVAELSETLGNILIPVVLVATTGFVALVKAIIAIPEFVKENQKAFTALGVAILALNGNNIRAAASAIAHSAAETARAIVTRATTIAQNLQLAVLIAMEAQEKRATTTTYLGIAAEKLKAAATQTSTAVMTGLRAIMAALTVENIKNSASSTASAAIEKGRALITNGVASAQAALKAVTTALTLENIKNTASAVYHTAVEKGRAAITRAVAVAQGILNAVMTANPIGAVIALVALLVAGFVSLYSNSQTLRTGVAGLWNAIKTVGSVIADVWSAITSLDFVKVASVIGDAGTKIAKSFTDGYQAKIKEEAPKIVKQHKDIVDQKTDHSKKGADDAANAEILAANLRADTIGEIDQKASTKRKTLKDKELEDFRKAEEQYDEQVKRDREKALELLSTLEAEHDQAMATTSLEIEEIKIKTKADKRKKEILDSTVDKTTQTQVLEAIEKSSQAELDKVREEYRLKRIKEEEEAAQKRLETENFIREQEKQAEMTVFDWREMQAKGNANKLAAIQKERVDVELRLTLEKIASEKIAEEQKASALIQNGTELAAAMEAIETKFIAQNMTAVLQATEKKKAIDKDLYDQKAANLQKYSNLFGSILQGDVKGAVAAAGQILGAKKEAMSEESKAFVQMVEFGAQVAQQAVDFLGQLAQKKAEKAIAEAMRERDEKVAVLTAELQQTEQMIEQSSKHMEDVKTNEQNRLAELQRILTSETTSEQEKRDAMSKFYSAQLQDMKAAEEQRIQDLQRMANEAKTDDERRAVEAKMELAKKESAEKIRLAEEEAASKTDITNELTEFTSETTEKALKEASDASDKQIELAENEAESKADAKIELEELIASENEKARIKEIAEKRKAFAAEKKAKIASALISGASAVLSALATPPIFVGIVMAAIAAGLTAVQIAKIKSQPEPQFSRGGTLGHIPQGGRHGSIYGTGGIGLIDRASGRDVGEMEGGEAIVSVEQTEANWPILQRMFQHARTPGKERTPVIPHPATPLAFRDGGRFESPYFEQGMYLFGSKKKAKKAANEANVAAWEAQKEADAATADAMNMSDGGGFDAGAMPDGGGEGDRPDLTASNEAFEVSQKQGQKQIELQEDTVDALLEVKEAVLELKASINGVESSVNSVRDAVNAANTHGRFDQLIGAISSMSA